MPYQLLRLCILRRTRCGGLIGIGSSVDETNYGTFMVIFREKKVGKFSGYHIRIICSQTRYNFVNPLRSEIPICLFSIYLDSSSLFTQPCLFFTLQLNLGWHGPTILIFAAWNDPQFYSEGEGDLLGLLTLTGERKDGHLIWNSVNTCATNHKAATSWRWGSDPSHFHSHVGGRTA
jgi:hypothetical protein